jgi:hypothetical protein
VDHFRFDIAAKYGDGSGGRSLAGAPSCRSRVEIVNPDAWLAGDLELRLCHDHVVPSLEKKQFWLHLKYWDYAAAGLLVSIHRPIPRNDRWLTRITGYFFIVPLITLLCWSDRWFHLYASIQPVSEISALVIQRGSWYHCHPPIADRCASIC